LSRRQRRLFFSVVPFRVSAGPAAIGKAAGSAAGYRPVLALPRAPRRQAWPGGNYVRIFVAQALDIGA
jgi:hypothetical protein